MKVIIDLLPLSTRRVGPVIVAENLVKGWHRRFPQDHLTVLGGEGSALSAELANMSGVRFHGRTGRGELSRAWRELVATPPDGGHHAWVSLNPTLPLRIPAGLRSAVVLHDERHRQRPEDFRPASRLYRNLAWERALRCCDVIMTSSLATSRALLERRPELAKKVHSLPLGNDHVPAPSNPVSRQGILALCHRSNKPAIEAATVWARARQLNPDVETLDIVGGSPDTLAPVRSRFAQEIEAGTLTLWPALDDETFDRLRQQRRVLLFLSHFEGFGLPALEAMRLAQTVIAYELPSLREILGPHRALAPLGDREVAAQLLAAAFSPNAHSTEATTIPWSDAAFAVRNALVPQPALTGHPHCG